jgi:hypothetical protein
LSSREFRGSHNLHGIRDLFDVTNRLKSVLNLPERCESSIHFISILPAIFSSSEAAYRKGAAAFKAGRAARDNIILGEEFNWVEIEDLKARPIEIEINSGSVPAENLAHVHHVTIYYHLTSRLSDFSPCPHAELGLPHTPILGVSIIR